MIALHANLLFQRNRKMNVRSVSSKAAVASVALSLIWFAGCSERIVGPTKQFQSVRPVASSPQDATSQPYGGSLLSELSMRYSERPESDLDGDVGNPGGAAEASSGTCTIASRLCAQISYKYDLGFFDDEWQTSYSADWNREELLRGSFVLAGTVQVRRGVFPGLKVPIGCYVTISKGCGSTNFQRGTCHLEKNTINTFFSVRGIDYQGGIWSGSMTLGDGCEAPPSTDNCSGGGSGDPPFGTEMLCQSGGGGGQMLICSEAWVKLEISYDSGLTWETLWEGWGEECEWNEAT